MLWQLRPGSATVNRLQRLQCSSKSFVPSFTDKAHEQNNSYISLMQRPKWWCKSVKSIAVLAFNFKLFIDNSTIEQGYHTAHVKTGNKIKKFVFIDREAKKF